MPPAARGSSSFPASRRVDSRGGWEDEPADIMPTVTDPFAFAYRDATFATVIAGMWPDPADNEANTAWVRDFYEVTAPHSEEGGYVNFMAGDDQERIRVNYRENYDRLVDVKRKYDPDNLFHLKPEHQAIASPTRRTR
jgi:hypothetical protein